MSIRVHPWFRKRGAWLIVVLTILFVFFIRVRLRDMPLERDEGEYAYAGQLILQGVPPYKEAYNMKLPGTYAAYALIMAVVGQTASGIHLGVAVINGASIMLVFLIGRKLLDEAAGVVAAISYALLSTSPAVFGLAGHATHFVVLPALAGTLLLLWAREQALNRAFDAEFNKREQRERGLSIQESINPAVQEPNSPRIGAFVSFVTFCSSYSVLITGFLFGLAFLMKQHGIFFGVFGGLYLAFSHIYEPRSIKEKREQGGARDIPVSRNPESGVVRTPRPTITLKAGHGVQTAPRRYGNKLPPIAWPRLFKELALYSAGFAIPYLVTCLILWAAGVFPQFTFWTITYARKYTTLLPQGIGNDAMRVTLSVITGPNILLWIVPWFGALLVAWEQRLANEHRFFFVVLLLCSFGSISVGFFFREHYFITLLPVLALLTGLAVSRAIRLVKHDTTIELFLAIPIFLLFGLGLLISIGGNAQVWFAMSPTEVVERLYATTLFTEARKLGEYLRNNTDDATKHRTLNLEHRTSNIEADVGTAGSYPDGATRPTSTNPSIHQSNNPPVTARLAVLGSEPEIYFYSHRRSATGYIYMYPLMETQPFAAKMQQEMIDEVEKTHPKYVIYVDYYFSWLRRADSPSLFAQWWQNYSTSLDLVQTVDINLPPDISADQADLRNLIGKLLVYRTKGD